MTHQVVLLHGWGMHAGVWDGVRARLGARDTLACDLPGYGTTPAGTTPAGTTPALAPYTLDGIVERLACEVDAQVDLVGWSLGGLLALHWAARRPTQIRRLVLLGTTPCFVSNPEWPHGVPAAMFRIFMAQLKKEPDALLQRFCALQAEGECSADHLSTMLYAMRAQAPVQTLIDTLALLGASDIRATLTSLTQPTLILHGERDAVVPAGAGRWMGEQLPHATLQTISGAGHALPVAHAEACAEAMDYFLNE